MHRHIKLLSIEETTPSRRDECAEKARIHGLGRLALRRCCGETNIFAKCLQKFWKL